MNRTEFDSAFAAVSDNPPFPWQWNLYQKFLVGEFPASCNLPTGLGKTSVIHIWLLALTEAPNRVPRRLVYVVNRRTVVDQSTEETQRLRNRLVGANGPPTEIQVRIADNLARLSSDPSSGPLAISTLRGQFADNREWNSDPARPAVICGTVDMIGSRLLFSGYGVGFKGRPLHAGFLGQDVLLVHDEAHLEPAFQKLLLAIECEQHGGQLNDRCECVKQGKKAIDFRPLRVMELSATSRGEGEVFKLSKEDEKNELVKQRIHAPKAIVFHAVDDEKKQLADKLVELALVHKDSKCTVLVFVRSVEDVGKIVAKLLAQKSQVQQLTGTLRGLERDKLVDHPIFQRFLPGAKEGDSTAYLVCTGAGEVGVNISADHLVCDLSPFESMAQRFGRVNRFGDGAMIPESTWFTLRRCRPKPRLRPKKRKSQVNRNRSCSLMGRAAAPSSYFNS